MLWHSSPVLIFVNIVEVHFVWTSESFQSVLRPRELLGWRGLGNDSDTDITEIVEERVCDCYVLELDLQGRDRFRLPSDIYSRNNQFLA